MEIFMALLKDGTYAVSFPSSIDYLEKVEALTVKVARELRFEESTIDDLSIATTELFNNAIHHGNDNDETKKVFLKFKSNGKQLTISIRDQGDGFSPESLKDPLAPENLLADSGRGIYLVKMLMDEIEFNNSQSGCEVIIRKRIQ